MSAGERWARDSWEDTLDKIAAEHGVDTAVTCAEQASVPAAELAHWLRRARMSARARMLRSGRLHDVYRRQS